MPRSLLQMVGYLFWHQVVHALEVAQWAYALKAWATFEPERNDVGLC